GRRRGAARRPLRDSGPWGPCVAPCQTHQPVGTLAPARLGSVAMRSTVPREAPSECRGAGWAWPSERGTSEDWTSRDARRGLPEGDNSVAGLLLHLEGLDHVALRDVDALAEADTALEALADLGDVVLLAAQRLDGELLLDHDAVAHQAGLGIAADGPGPHDRTGDVADLGGAEDLADLRRAQLDLLVLRL